MRAWREAVRKVVVGSRWAQRRAAA